MDIGDTSCVISEKSFNLCYFSFLFSKIRNNCNSSLIGLIWEWNEYIYECVISILISCLVNYCLCSVAQLCQTLSDPMESSPPDSFVHGIFHTRILEWVAIFYSRGTSQPRNQICISCIDRWILYHCTTRETQYIITIVIILCIFINVHCLLNLLAHCYY